MLIPNRDLDLWNSDFKILFLANQGPKTQSCPFCLKIGAHSISWMLIPNADLHFCYFEPKIPFWWNLDQKFQSCLRCLKIDPDIIWTLLRSNPGLDFWNSNRNWFLGNFRWKIQSCSLTMLIPNLDLNFWNSDPKIVFGPNLGPKNQICLICVKIGTNSISRMLILNQDLKFPPENPFQGKFEP